jgi:hypothetical protein
LQKAQHNQIFSGFALLGGAMIRDLAIASTAFEVDVKEVKKAGNWTYNISHCACTDRCHRNWISIAHNPCNHNPNCCWAEP